jgi:hypothetical protein
MVPIYLLLPAAGYEAFILWAVLWLRLHLSEYGCCIFALQCPACVKIHQ